MQHIRTIVKRVEGSSGTRIYGGYIYEDYLSQLISQQRAFIFDKMRRQDPACGQLINIMNNVLCSLSHSIKIKPKYADVSEAEKQKECIEMILFHNMHRSFDEVLKDIYTQNIYGYSIFEGLWKNEVTETYGPMTVLKDLLWRSPKTIWEFHLDQDENLDYVVQRAYGDSQSSDVKMPGENTFIFTCEREGKDFEGISPLRRVYGPWQIKQELLNLLIIGSDKYSVPTVMFKSAVAGTDSATIEKMEAAIMEYQGGNNSYLIFPPQFEPQYPKYDFKPEELIKGIELCNNEIIKESSATFLEMQKGGSYALGSAMIQFFYNAIDAKSKMIAAPFNTRIIPALIAMNKPNEPCMVELMFSAAGQSVSKDYADSLSKLTQQGMITPDDTLESFLRKNMNLPEQDMETIRVSQNGTGNMGEDVDDGNVDDEDDEDGDSQYSRQGFAASYKRAPNLIKQGKRSLMLAAERIIDIFAIKMQKSLMAHYKKAKNESEILDFPKVALSFVRPTSILYHEMGMLYDVSRQNLDKELKAIERRRGVKSGAFSQTFAKAGKVYAKKDAELMAQAIGNEVQDTLGGAYISLAVDAKNFEDLEAKLTKEANAIKKKGAIRSGVSLAASEVVNRGRTDTFKEIENKIESYTYHNDEPQTDFCNYLNGKTMKPSDLKTPPFHWGCDGYIVPNLKRWKNNPNVDKIQITAKLRKGMKFLQ